MVITNPAVAVFRMIAQMVKRNVQEEFRKHVQVVYGLVAQNALQIRFAAAAVVPHVLRVSMYTIIPAKTIA
jgi:hypothetical protein